MTQATIQKRSTNQPPSLDQLNRMIHEYGESIRKFFREQQRSSLVSPMFNIPGRMVLGGYCYYERLPRLLEIVVREETPEEIGRRMKRCCSLPNYISLNSLMIGYFNAREQARLWGGMRADNLAEISVVLDFWSRVAAAYRNDGLWLPDQSVFDVPILPRTEVEALAVRLQTPPDETRRQVRRMMATLELFTFILNGEARIGVFHHGPYPLAGGDVLVVRELVGLQEDYYPWATPDVRLPYPSIARVLRLRNVRAKMVLMGSMITEPKSVEDHVVAEGLFFSDDGRLQPLPATEVPRITQLAGDIQLELYRRMTGWDDRYRVEYGAELYGCILNTFAPPGRRAEFRAAIRDAFRPTIERHLEDLFTGKEPPLVLQHIASTKGPIYSPIAA